MPALEKIVISNFRNIEFQEISFSPNINCICGNNGEGKTNLLDAIYYLALTKSAFSPSDKYVFRHGSDSFSMCGTFRMPTGLESKISLQVTSSEKKIKRDDKPYRRISEHIGLIPVVMVAPSDISLVSESGEDRRKFANAVLSQMDKEYLSAVQQYTRLLAQRNKLLKEPVVDDGFLDVVDMRLAAFSKPIWEKRKKFAEDVSPLVNDIYSSLSKGSETVEVKYSSDLDKAPLESLLEASREKDKFLKYTSCGVQRDDFLFNMDSFPIRKCGSQGQQKTFLVALKFAQYELMKKEGGQAPILLLDDVFDKLDLSRIANLIKMVASNDFGQIFITDTDRSRMKSVVDSVTSDRAYFETVGGTFNGR